MDDDEEDMDDTELIKVPLRLHPLLLLAVCCNLARNLSSVMAGTFDDLASMAESSYAEDAERRQFRMDVSQAIEALSQPEA